MKIEEVRFLFEYHYWARDIILAGVGKLTPGQYLETHEYCQASVGSILVHLLSAEWIWRVRVQEQVYPTRQFSLADLPTLAALQERWRQQETALRGYLGSLDDPDLEQKVRYQSKDGLWQENILWRVLLHVVNHATEHRGILAMYLTGYGFSPGDLDLAYFARLKGV